MTVAAVDTPARADQGAAPALVPHSADYDSTHWTREHNSRTSSPPPTRRAEKRRIGVLRCDAADPRGLLSGVVYGDLHGVADPAERRRIVLAVARGEVPAARPSPRIFGGSMKLENRRFTGRDDRLAAMHAALSAADDSRAVHAAALTQAAVWWNIFWLIPTVLTTDRCPLAGGDGSDPIRVLDQELPGITAGVDNGLVGIPDDGA
ncbi:MAG TPA: hypothetical protein VND19_24450, partial [Acetobacteraceae bacterium]|nr:hypothetical protein [Acetobacteraceae bacterium]